MTCELEDCFACGQCEPDLEKRPKRKPSLQWLVKPHMVTAFDRLPRI